MLKIGVVIADMGEYRPLSERLQERLQAKETVYGMEKSTFLLNGAQVVCICSRIGKVNATIAATHLAENGCNVILNFGYSGGISRAPRGAVVLADRFIEHDFDLTPLGYKPCEKPEQDFIYMADPTLLECFVGQLPNAPVGTAVCGDRFICNEADRIRMKNDFDAVSCDMETGAIASVCHFADVPFMAMRQISDDAGDDASDSYREKCIDGETTMADAFFNCLCAVIEKFKNEA